MPRSNRGTRFKEWCRYYFNGRRHFARDIWRIHRKEYGSDYYEERISHYFRRLMEVGRENYALRERIENLKATILQLEAELDDLRQWLRP
jgi:predicted RNase H-like nuclease (RuvC/YqgF family)